MNKHLEKRKQEMKNLVDKMANPRQDLHELYKSKMKEIILNFLESMSANIETGFNLNSFYGREQEFISEWVENSFRKQEE